MQSANMPVFSNAEGILLVTAGNLAFIIASGASQTCISDSAIFVIAGKYCIAV